MAKVDVEKLQHQKERRELLEGYLSEGKYTSVELDTLMGWETKREKSVLFGQLRDFGKIPALKNNFITEPKTGEEVNDPIYHLIPAEDYATFENEQKEELLARKKKAKKKLKDPEGMRKKAEKMVIDRKRKANKAILELTIKRNEENELKYVIANANVRLAEIKRDKTYERLIEALELKGMEELHSIADLNDLV